MRITTKGRYALRAVLSLALAPDSKPVSIRQIAQTEDLSPEFLEQIFFKLKKTGVIISSRGPGGGFKLNRNPEDISLLEILEGSGEETTLTPCSNGNDDCPNESNCIAHKVWVRAAEEMKNYLSGITLKNIVENNGDLPD